MISDDWEKEAKGGELAQQEPHLAFIELKMFFFLFFFHCVEALFSIALRFHIRHEGEGVIRREYQILCENVFLYAVRFPTLDPR